MGGYKLSWSDTCQINLCIPDTRLHILCTKANAITLKQLKPPLSYIFNSNFFSYPQGEPVLIDYIFTCNYHVWFVFVFVLMPGLCLCIDVWSLSLSLCLVFVFVLMSGLCLCLDVWSLSLCLS